MTFGILSRGESDLAVDTKMLWIDKRAGKVVPTTAKKYLLVVLYYYSNEYICEC